MDEHNECLMFYDKKFNFRLCKSKENRRPERFFLPRMSLLGKPLHYTRAHRHARSRRQGLIYNFLERPRGWMAFLYHTMVFLMVFACLGISIFATIETYQKEAIFVLYRMEVVVVLWLSIEFVIRLWASGCRSRYQGCVGRLKFIAQTFCVVDIVTIAASSIALGIGAPGRVFATSTLRGLRYFQILRMLRMDRRGGSWKLLGSVVYAHRKELITTVYIGFLGLICAAFSVYLAEKDVNEQFRNFPQSLWWGFVTLCTIGYGDMVPVTWQGKLISTIATLLTYSFFALPAGILGSGFALKVQQQQRQKHMISRYQPAAMLIQAVWRCYAADDQSTSVATWKIHEVHLSGPPNYPKFNGYFATRLPTIRRQRNATARAPHGDAANVEAQILQKPFKPSATRDKNTIPEQTEFEFFPPCKKLTNHHKIAIRFIRLLKYMVARRKFKEALKPYDVKDVMEQYAVGHADLLGRVKNIHARLDQILGGKRAPKIKDANKICLASRIVNVERQVSNIEEKLDFLIRAYMRDHEKKLQGEHELRPSAASGTEPDSAALRQVLKPTNDLLERIKNSEEKAISSSCDALHTTASNESARLRHHSVSGDGKSNAGSKRSSVVTFVDEIGDFEEADLYGESDIESKYPSSDIDAAGVTERTTFLQIPHSHN